MTGDPQRQERSDRGDSDTPGSLSGKSVFDVGVRVEPSTESLPGVSNEQVLNYVQFSIKTSRVGGVKFQVRNCKV